MGRPLSGQPLLQTEAALPEAAGKGRPSRNVAVTFQKHKQKINQGLKRTRGAPAGSGEAASLCFCQPSGEPRVCVRGRARCSPVVAPSRGYTQSVTDRNAPAASSSAAASSEGLRFFTSPSERLHMLLTPLPPTPSRPLNSFLPEGPPSLLPQAQGS